VKERFIADFAGFHIRRDAQRADGAAAIAA
jgi:hypothetical protein